MKLSLITINLNHATGLEGTIRSVLGQTYHDYELIVVDGGSTDGSLDVIRSHESRITRWVSEPDSGIYNAMNKGLKWACGEYVCFLNSGDRFHSPDVLSTVFSGGRYNEDLLYGDVTRPDGAKGPRTVRHPEELTVARFFGSGVCHQAIFYKKELFDTLGAYDENLKLAGDWDFTLRVLLARRPTRHIPFVVVDYEGYGRSVIQARLAEEEKVMVQKRLLPQAVYQDYRHLKSLEAECGRLKQFEDWVQHIRNRNVLVNIAMVFYWFLLKMKRGLQRQIIPDR